MSEEALAQAEKLIPAKVVMISGCKDAQTSADVSNVSNFQLPDPAGKAGGACTSAFLKVLYADEKAPDEDLTFQDVLLQMRDILKSKSFSQIPQLTSSRPLDIKHKFEIVPEDFSGNRHALIIGINYHGQNGELRGCIADALNMSKYIQDIHGFSDENITYLLDDDDHEHPTKDNILAAYKKLVDDAQPGDVVFCHYSGHGASIKDDDGDEKDGMDETLVPLDYESAGLIRDDDLFKMLVGPMAGGVTMTCIYDCCHSGTVLDLPYEFIADGSQEEMTMSEDFDFSTLIALFNAYQASQAAGEDPLQAIMKMCGCDIM